MKTITILFVIIANSVICKSQITISLQGVDYSTAAWGDYDNDNDLDILLTGSDGVNRYSDVYRNDGSDNFTNINAGLEGVTMAGIDWGDYDNDGDLDILMMGSGSGGAVSKIYRNEGNDNFVDINISLPATQGGTVSWVDLDNDGDLDFLLTGFQGTAIYSKPYKNNGNEIFTTYAISQIAGRSNTAIDFGDYDNDGDLDALYSGHAGFGGSGTTIYRNNGNDYFTNLNVGFTGVSSGAVAWGDYDNDGDLDALISGATGDTPARATEIYRNENGIFTNINAGVIAVNNGSVDWGDYDNDGDLDILISGYPDNGILITKIYINNGNETFSDAGIELPGIKNSTTIWGDYDNDGDLDILLSGNTNSELITKIYKNNNTTPNTAPNTPTNLSADVDLQDVILSWNAATDIETPSEGLSYNVFVRTATDNIVMPNANIANGYTKVTGMGNAQLGTDFILKGLDYGTYYWKVQAVDNSFNGSLFSAESSFTIVAPPSIPQNLKSTTISSSQINISWDDNNDETGYELWRSLSAGSGYELIFTAGQNETTYSDTDLGANTEYFYKVKAINSGGESAFSAFTSDATLPLVFNLSGNASYCAGQSGVSITLSSSESGVNYQLKKNGTDEDNPVEGDGSALVWDNKTTGTYTVVATNPTTSKSNDMSGSAEVTQNSLPTVFTVSGTDSYCAGESGKTVTLSGSQSGVNYQLKKNGDIEGSPISGTGSELNWTNKTTGSYMVVATNTSTTCASIMGLTAVITENPLPIVNAGENKSIPYGTSTQLNGSASGGSQDFSFAWTPADKLVDANVANPSTQNLTKTTIFSFDVIDNQTGCKNSDETTVTVTGSALTVDIDASETTICSEQTIQLQAIVSGGSGEYSYLWASNPVGFSSTEASPTVAPSENTNYVVDVDDGFNTTNSIISIIVNPLPERFDVSGSGSYCNGDNGLTVHLSGSQTGVNYQLKKDGSTVGDMVEGDNNTLNWSQLQEGTYTIAATLSATGCFRPMNGNAIITENPLPIVNAGENKSIPYGTSTQLNGSAPGGSQDFSFAWTPADKLVDANVANPTTQNLTKTTIFSFDVIDNQTGCKNSDETTVTVTGSALTVDIDASETTICSGQTIQLQAIVSGGSGEYSYLWASNPVGFTSTEASPTVAPSENTNYVVDVDDGFNTTNSIISIIVNPLPERFDVSGSGSYCNGDNGLTVHLSGSQTGVNYQLKKDGSTEGDMIEGDNNTLNWSQLQEGTYTIAATLSATGCFRPMNGNAIITENPLPIVNAGENKSIPYGTSTQLNGSAPGGSQDFSFAWTPADKLVDANVANPSTQNLTKTTIFSFDVIDNQTGCKNSDETTVTVTGSALTVDIDASETTICSGQTIQLQAIVSGGSGEYSYLWASNPVGFSSTEASPTVQVENITTFHLTVNDANNSTNAHLTVYLHQIDIQSIDITHETKCNAADATISISATGTAPLQYSIVNPEVFGSGSYFTGLTPNDYNITVKDTYGCKQSVLITIKRPETPAIPEVSGGGIYCAGDIIDQLSANSTDESIINWYTDSNKSNKIQTGSTYTPVNLTETMTYYITAAKNDCESNAATLTVTILSLPLTFNLSGADFYCAATDGTNIQLENSEEGINYQLCKNELLDGNPVAGTGSAIVWEHKYEGNYTVVAQNDATGCKQQMTGNHTISEIAKPTAYSITGDNQYCEGENGVTLTLENSQSGVEYRLYKNNQLQDTQDGTTSAIHWNDAPIGEYTILAIDKTYSCENLMLTTFEISTYSIPEKFDVSGGGNTCAGSIEMLSIDLSNSETGVSYQLFNYGSTEGEPISGTGNSLTWQADNPGKYTVEATDNQTQCKRLMQGEATVIDEEGPPQPAISPNSDICVNETIECTNSDVIYLYEWLLNDTTVEGENDNSIIPQQPGDYKLIITDKTTKCFNFVEFTVIAAVEPVILHKFEAAENFDLLFLDNNPHQFESYQWYKNSVLMAGETKQHLAVRQAGNYAVEIVDKNGCRAISNEHVISYKKSLQLYPNPATEIVNIAIINRQNGEIQTNMFNSFGVLVHSYKNHKTTQKMQYTLPLNKLLPGVYTIQVISGEEIYNKKIIVR